MTKKKEEKQESNEIAEDICSKEPEEDTHNFKSVASLIYKSEKIQDTKHRIVSFLNSLIKKQPHLIQIHCPFPIRPRWRYNSIHS